MVSAITFIISMTVMDGVCYSDCAGSDGGCDHFGVDRFVEESVYRHRSAQRGQQVLTPPTSPITPHLQVLTPPTSPITPNLQVLTPPTLPTTPHLQVLTPPVYSCAIKSVCLIIRAISHVKWTLFYPIITFLLLTLCIAYWAVTAMYPLCLCVFVRMCVISEQRVFFSSFFFFSWIWCWLIPTHD